MTSRSSTLRAPSVTRPQVAHDSTSSELGPSLRIATLVFLLSEALFFLILILVLVYYRAYAPPEVMVGQALLKVGRTGIFTIALVASSVTLWLAERNKHQGNRRGLQMWLLVTVVLGAIFLIGQATEYMDLYAEGLTIQTNLFGTQFYTLTGLHFLHVTAGVIMLAIVCGLAFFGRPHEPGDNALVPISYYWHFVDVVWIALFTVVYLL